MADRKAYIVFKGKPSFWFDNDTADRLDALGALGLAEREAADKALEDQEDYTVLQVILPDGRPMGLTARYHGVIMHDMDEDL